MCKKQIWKRGLLSLGLAAMCFLAEPAGMWVYATEDAQTPGTEGQPADAAVTQPPEMQSEDIPPEPSQNEISGISPQSGEATEEQKNAAKQSLQSYMGDLKTIYNLDDEGMAKLNTVYKAAEADITNNVRTEAALNDFVVTTKSALENVAYLHINSKNDTSDDDSNIKVDNPDRIINDDDRGDADADLLYYMQSLEVRYHLDEKVMENLHKVFDSAVYYIANTEMTVGELAAYVSSTKGSMESAAVANVTVTTSEFLQVGDNWATPTVSYGQSVSIVLPIINFGTEELNDLIIEPATSTIVTEWPFVPDKTGYLQTEPYIPGNKTYDAAMQNRREFTFHFTAREDVMSGYYPLKFRV